MGVKQMMRRLRCGVPWNCRERKKSTDRGWNREEVLTSVEGVVVLQGIPCRGCLEEVIRGGTILWWWKIITWLQVGEEE
jgi:hypothetical protein